MFLEDVTHYTKAAGLFDDLLFTVLEDGRGHLWLSSNKGMNLPGSDLKIPSRAGRPPSSCGDWRANPRHVCTRSPT